jgi:hypothetical protein
MDEQQPVQQQTQEQSTRNERREIKREAQQAATRRAGRAHALHRFIPWLIVLAIVIGIFFAIKSASKTAPATAYTSGPVHWHAAFKLSVCGVPRDLPGPQDGSMVGPALYHHHGDNTWHIEGRIFKKEDIALGKFFDVHGIPFDRDQLLDKKNGDTCPDGRAGEVQMFVNGASDTQFRDYIAQSTPESSDQVIEIKFEPRKE